MSYVQTALTALGVLFGLVVVLGILVTGFFKGRQWLARGMSVNQFGDSGFQQKRDRAESDRLTRKGL